MKTAMVFVFFSFITNDNFLQQYNNNECVMIKEPMRCIKCLFHTIDHPAQFPFIITHATCKAHLYKP